MKKAKKIKKLDKFYYHEALDRTYIVANQIEDILVEHPVIIKHKELRKRVKRAQQLILEAYQLIGGLDVKLFPNKQKSKKQ
jgi:hypothetical protein